MSVRLFLGLPPSDAAREALCRLIEGARDIWPAAKWVPAANLHYTLVFIGAQPESEVAAIGAAVDAAAAGIPAFDVGLGASGRFPERGRARVLWVGASIGGEGMTGLAAACSRALAPWSAPDDRPYAPHLTIARFKVPVVFDDSRLAQAEPTPPWLVEDVVLYRSRLARPSPVYEEVHRAPLAP